MSRRWKCRNTRRRSSSSTFWPIRPERLQEEHPAGGLDEHDHAQRADDHHQRVRRAAVDDRRDAVVDAALHEERNRKARSVFHHDDDGEQRDRHAVRPQQRAQQRPRLAPARQRSRRSAGRRRLLVEPAAPALDRLVGILGRPVGVGGGHRPSASDARRHVSVDGPRRPVGGLLLLDGPCRAGCGPRRPPTRRRARHRRRVRRRRPAGSGTAAPWPAAGRACRRG